jgi:hypothetical protein
MPEDYRGLIWDAPADWFPFPDMRELAVCRMLGRFPILILLAFHRVLIRNDFL